ncbi:MAG: nucleotidyl transferase AbiEii/AbiGii toxin family protein, partial [Calditrichia bacterium]
ESSRNENLNRLRQILQVVLLKIVYESATGSSLAFTGGTALRFLYQLPRYSEDLDFSLIRPEKYKFNQLLDHIRKNLEKLALQVDLKRKEEKTVHQIDVRFRELLFDAGLSPHKQEKLPVRLEIDTNPPAGWNTEITLFSDIYTIPILRFDLSSSFATKIHACLFRPYTKGRDYYDLMWYMGKKVVPNLIVLENAIRQTEGEKQSNQFDGNVVKNLLLKKISTLDFIKLKQDVAPFLEHIEEESLLEPELMKQVISGYEF